MPSFRSGRPARPEAPAGNTGFTLIELLVGLVISGLLATAILRLVAAESRFVATQGARQEVLQNARGTLEALGGELRAITSSGLLEARDSAVRFLYPRVWGVVCTDTPPGASELILAVPWLGSEAAYGVASGGALASNAGVAVNSEVAGWRAARATEAVLGPLGTTCLEGGASGAELRQLRIRGMSMPVAAARGDLAYVYEELKYDLGISSGIPGVWVRRSVGMSGGALSQQPLAGPVVKGGGLRFRYRLANGVEKHSLGASELPEVVGIGARLTVQSQARGGGAPQDRSDSIFVRIRN